MSTLIFPQFLNRSCIHELPNNSDIIMLRNIDILILSKYFEARLYSNQAPITLVFFMSLINFSSYCELHWCLINGTVLNMT